MNRKSLSVCRKQSRLNVTLTQGKKSLIIEHSDMHLYTKQWGLGIWYQNLLAKSSNITALQSSLLSMERCFYQWVVSFSLISAGNWATSDLEIDRSVSAPGPEPVSQCESVSDFRKWYDGTVWSNHLKLGIKFLNHRRIIILSICTTNPRLNERYTTTVPVRQKINHSLHSPKEIGAIHWKSIFKN